MGHSGASKERHAVRWAIGDYAITDCPDDLDIELIFHFLSSISYWSKGIPREVVVRSLENSLCLGVFKGEQQVGFGRAVTDQATFAYLADVFILKKYRGQGLGKWLVECILAHPELQDLRRWMLATADAHRLYRQYDFVSLSDPERFMEKSDPDIYQRGM